MPHLRDCGVEVRALPFWSGPAYARMQAGQLHAAGYALRAAQGYARRLKDVGSAGRADGVWIHRSAAPVGTALLGAVVRRLGRPLVFGFDDAVHVPSGGKNLLRRWLGSWRDTDWLLSRSRLVIARNGGLATYARRHNRQVVMIPAAIDVAQYDRVLADMPSRSGTGSVFVVGWIGTPATVPYLEVARPALEALGRDGPVELRIIGGRAINLANVSVRHIPWHEDTEIHELAQVDVGLAPMPDDEWARGKSGLKVVQYMGCGLPTVASAVGAHLELLEHGRQGLLVRTTVEWLEALRALRDDLSLRVTLGRAARETARLRHDFPLVARAHAEALTQACTR